MKKKDMYLDLDIKQDKAYRQLAETMAAELVALTKKKGLIDTRVHELRKQLKKMRALLRLIRIPIGNSKYKSCNYFFRDFGREFGDARDAKVRVGTLQSLKEPVDESIEEKAFNRLEELLVVEHKNAKKKLNRNFWKEMQMKSASAKPLIVHNIHKPDGFKTYKKSVKKVYKGGYKALKIAIENPKAEELHEFRKQVKYLRYQLTFLDAMWPKMLQTMEDVMHDLSDLLGNDHDLYDLVSWLEENDWPQMSENEKELLKGLACKKQSVFRSEALKLGQKIYYESPSQFINRLESYW